MDGSSKKAGGLFGSWLGRGSDAETTGRAGHREPEHPEDWPEALPFRKRPKPYSRAIPWSPASEHPLIPSLRPPEPDKSRPYELFVAQSALREVRHHLITASAREPFGFLLGQVVFCPWSEVPYIVIDAVRRETQNLPSSSEVDRFRHAWIAANRDARHRRAQLIGWYHQHGVLGLRLSEWDLQLQDEFFPEPWQCALIIAYANGPTGGFIQRSRRARLFRKGLAPFYELIELDAKLVDGLRPSVVDWGNYVASQDVHVIEAEWPDAEAQQRKWRASPHAVEKRGVLEFPAPEEVQEPREEPAGSEAPPEKGEAEPPREAAPPPPPAEPPDEAREQVVAEPPAAARQESVGRPEDERGAQAPEPVPSRVLETPMLPPEEAESLALSPFTPASGDVHPPEPAEVDRTRSSEWLAELMGEVLAHRRTSSRLETADGDSPEAEEADGLAAGGEETESADPGAVEPPAGGAEEAERAEPGEVADAGGPLEGALQPEEPVTGREKEPEPVATSRPEPARPAVPRPAPPRVDRPGARDRPIPFVLVEEEPWRPTRKMIRAAAGAVILVGVGLSARALLGGPEPEFQTTPGDPGITAFRQPPEFIRLSTEFRQHLQEFRTDFIDFQLGAVPCDVLASDLLAVRAAHQALDDFVATDRRTVAAFSALDADYAAAADRFAATACPLPPPDSEGGGIVPDEQSRDPAPGPPVPAEPPPE